MLAWTVSIPLYQPLTTLCSVWVHAVACIG
jgi:hypothetical protein